MIGVPDDRYGEEICAWVKLRPGVAATEDEIKAFCREQIAHYKVPRYVKFVDEFPMTVTGKIRNSSCASAQSTSSVSRLRKRPNCSRIRDPERACAGLR